jgi:hypothetical protein
VSVQPVDTERVGDDGGEGRGGARAGMVAFGSAPAGLDAERLTAPQ